MASKRKGYPVFVDTFSNLNNWSKYNSAGQDGNGLRRPSQITVSNHVVTISGLANGTTGGMSLNGPEQQWGQWSITARAAKATGLYHPVILLWGVAGSNNPAGTNDQFGEIDIMEFWQCPNRDVNGTTLHYGDGSQMFEQDTPVTGDQWHQYNLVWTPEYAYAWIDDQPAYFHTDDASILPLNPMQLCVQLDWFPGEHTSEGFPLASASMQVNRVEIYTLDEIGYTP